MLSVGLLDPQRNVISVVCMLQAKVDELLDAVPKSVREEKYGW